MNDKKYATILVVIMVALVSLLSILLIYNVIDKKTFITVAMVVPFIAVGIGTLIKRNL